MMIVGVNSSKLKATKYEAYYFWENLIHSDAPIWQNGFRNLPLTEDSIFIYTVVMDQDKDFLKSRWAYYPDVYALLGFIQHVFLPTAFFTLLDDTVAGFNIPLTTGEDLLNIMCQLEENLDMGKVAKMRDQLRILQELWRYSEEGSLEMLKQFSASFNSSWKDSDGKLVYFKLFSSPTEIGSYVMQGGDTEEEAFVDVIEEEIEMTQVQWQDICENVYSDAFIRKKFIDILNYKIGCLV